MRGFSPNFQDLFSPIGLAAFGGYLATAVAMSTLQIFLVKWSHHTNMAIYLHLTTSCGFCILITNEVVLLYLRFSQISMFLSLPVEAGYFHACL